MRFEGDFQLFEKMDADGNGMVLLDEWMDWIEKNISEKSVSRGEEIAMVWLEELLGDLRRNNQVSFRVML